MKSRQFIKTLLCALCCARALICCVRNNDDANCMREQLTFALLITIMVVFVRRTRRLQIVQIDCARSRFYGCLCCVSPTPQRVSSPVNSHDGSKPQVGCDLHRISNPGQPSLMKCFDKHRVYMIAWTAKRPQKIFSFGKKINNKRECTWT